MVALQILVLPVKVRILVGQLEEPDTNVTGFFIKLCQQVLMANDLRMHFIIFCQPLDKKQNIVLLQRF